MLNHTLIDVSDSQPRRSSPQADQRIGQTPLVIIRDRSPSDAGALEAIAVETHKNDGYPKYLPQDLRSFIVDADAMAAWVAAANGALLGHVALHRRSAPEVMDVALSATGLLEEEVVFIARLLVAPSARRLGVGKALLERATIEATQLGRRALLDVVEDHRAAIALYEACGWTRVGKVDWSLPGGLPLREFIYLSPEPAA
jgi:GNAT superfamily N-acetyltransferase